MAIQLPAIIARYFEASDAHDVEAITACFTDDAVVTDEGRTHRGREEVRRWRQEVDTAFEFTVEVLADAPRGVVEGLERHDVTGRLTGNFPGGTVVLVHGFGLREGRIARLDITP